MNFIQLALLIQIDITNILFSRMRNWKINIDLQENKNIWCKLYALYVLLYECFQEYRIKLLKLFYK